MMFLQLHDTSIFQCYAIFDIIWENTMVFLLSKLNKFRSQINITFSHNNFTHGRLPDRQARCNGVDPKWSGFCKCVPEYINNRIRSACPLYAAQWRAVSPLISISSFDAPIPRRKAAVAVLPNIQAVIKGVSPLKSAVLTVTPACNRTCTKAVWPEI